MYDDEGEATGGGCLSCTTSIGLIETRRPMFRPSPKPALSPSTPWPTGSRRSLLDRINETLNYLSDEIDSRRIGGLGEAQAAGYVAGRLRRAEYAAAVQSFRASVGEKLPLIVVAMLGAGAGVGAAVDVAWYWRSVALGIVVLALLLLYAELEGHKPLRRFVKGKTSQSVVAGRAATSKKIRHRVVVVAPLDGPPQAVFDRGELLLLYGTLLIEMLSIAGALLSTASVWRYLAGGCATALLLLGVWALARRITPRLLPAVHGAGELTTLLMVAEELEPLEAVEVWIVALGASSVGHESINALKERYPFSPSDTYIINLHRISAGQPVFVTREGLLRERRSERVLLALASNIDAADLTIDAEPRRLRQRTLAQLLFRLGYRGITIASHSDDSLFTRPDATTIERSVRLVVGMIQSLDK